MESRLIRASIPLRCFGGPEDLQPFLQLTIPTGRDSFIASINASEAVQDNKVLLAIKEADGLRSVVEPLNRSIVES